MNDEAGVQESDCVDRGLKPLFFWPEDLEAELVSLGITQCRRREIMRRSSEALQFDILQNAVIHNLDVSPHCPFSAPYGNGLCPRARGYKRCLRPRELTFMGLSDSRIKLPGALGKGCDLFRQQVMNVGMVET